MLVKRKAEYNGILVPVRTSFNVSGHKVDVDMLNAVKSVLADVSSVSPSSEQRIILKTTTNQ